MPSAYRDAKGWACQFKGLSHQPGAHQRIVRIPAAKVPAGVSEDEQRAAVMEIALSLEELCRSLELPAAPASRVRVALKAGAITDEQAKALLGGETPGIASKSRALTLQSAAEKHPATQRMPIAQRWNYFRWLADFEAFAGITTCRALTLNAVQKYLAHREKEGDAYDTRRHRLLFVRRAARYGTTAGIPDPLVGFKLDRQSTRKAIAVYTLADFAEVAVVLEKGEKWSELAALGLGAGVGLRPSETFAVDLALLKDDVLETGKKNDASHRKLPLPRATVLRWVQMAAGKRTTGPLFLGRYGRPFNPETWPKWVRRWMTDAGREIRAKELRKSFATWTARGTGLEKAHIEAFLGHDDGDLSQVTSRHYLADWRISELRPTAERIDALITEAMTAARTGQKAG